MSIKINEKKREAGFALPAALYSRDGLAIAAQIFAGRADVYLSAGKTTHAVTLKAKRPGALQELAGEFLNEALNQEYRMTVSAFNSKITSLIVTQNLLAARGGETPPEPPAGEKTPEFKAEVKRLLQETAEEIKKTMPKRIPPQGRIFPPEAEPVG